MTAFDELAAYAAGMPVPEDFEQRLFSDPRLAAEAAFLVDLLDGLRDLARTGAIVPVLTPGELRALVGAGVRIAEGTAHGEVARVRLRDDQDLVAAHLPVDLRSAVRIDVSFANGEASPHFTTRDAPFDPDSGEIVVLCRAHVARSGVRVVITDERDRTLGRFMLDVG